MKKFVNVQMSIKNIKFQLDTESNLTLINEKRGKKMADHLYRRRKELLMSLQEINQVLKDNFIDM